MKKIILALILTAQFNLFGQNRFVLSEQLLDSIICLTEIGSNTIPNVKANCNEKQQKHFYIFRFIPKSKYKVQISYTSIECSPDIPSNIYGIYTLGKTNVLILNDGIILDENLNSKILLSSDPLYKKIIEKYFIKNYDGVIVFENLAVLTIRNNFLNKNQYIIKSDYYIPYAKAPKDLWPIIFVCKDIVFNESYNEYMRRYGFETNIEKEQELQRMYTWKKKIIF